MPLATALQSACTSHAQARPITSSRGTSLLDATLCLASKSEGRREEKTMEFREGWRCCESGIGPYQSRFTGIILLASSRPPFVPNGLGLFGDAQRRNTTCDEPEGLGTFLKEGPEGRETKGRAFSVATALTTAT